MTLSRSIPSDTFFLLIGLAASATLHACLFLARPSITLSREFAVQPSDFSVEISLIETSAGQPEVVPDPILTTPTPTPESVPETPPTASLPNSLPTPTLAPLEMVRRRYAPDIQTELKDSLLREGLRHAVEKEKLHLVDDPAVEEANFEKDKKFKFILRVDLAPEFKLPAAKGLKIPKKSPEPVTEADVKSSLDRLAEPHAHFHTLEPRPAQEGDYAVLDFQGTCGGKKILEIAPQAGQVGEAKKLWVLLKPDAFLPGFVPALYGMKPGETRQVDVKFPADFPHATLQKQTGSYEVTLTELKERHVPEVDDAFCQENYKMPKTELEARVREDLTASRASAHRNEESRAVTQALLSSTKMDVPEPLLDEERRRLVARLSRRINAEVCRTKS